jgi:hypothetical protein
MSSAPDDFLRRWSRRKRAAAVAPAAPAPAPAQPPPALPALESVTFDSDFTAFMHAKVDEGVRRAALRKLFGDPRFNVMDGLDTYIDDYSIEDPIPEALLAQLEHARATLFTPQPDESVAAVAEPEPEPKADAAA